jgi:sugar-specific transcriptional regulator TrmB
MEKNIEVELASIGLSKDQARVYLFLLRNGALTAHMLSKRLGIARTLVYKVLSDLIDLHLVEKDTSFKVTRFSASHPYTLRGIVENRRRMVDNLAHKVESLITPLISEYNLNNERPNVHFMEGLSGLRSVLADTLTATETVLMFVDTTSLEKEVLDIDAEFAKKRLRNKKRKHILTPDSPEARSYLKTGVNDYTAIKLINKEYCGVFSAVQYIYDNKLAFLTFANSTYTATLLSDTQIYTMQRSLFKSLWHQAES